MITEQNTVSASTLSDLLAQVACAHKEYSRAYHARTDWEAELSAIAARRAAILKELRRSQRSLETTIQTSLAAAISDPVKASAAEIVSVRARVALLKQGLALLSCEGYAAAERNLLESKIAEYSFQLRLEQLRKEVHDASVIHSVAIVTGTGDALSLDGLGSKSQAMAANCETIMKTLRDLREQLRQHEITTAQAVKAYESEFTNV